MYSNPTRYSVNVHSGGGFVRYICLRSYLRTCVFHYHTFGLDLGKQQGDQRKRETTVHEKTASMTINQSELREYIECDACGATNPRKRCSRCRCAFYCSVDCQTKDWRESHKSDCVPYETMYVKLAGVEILPATTTPVNTACGICLEEPMQQQVVLKDCKHAFCFRCLRDWQAYSTNTAGLFAARNAATACPYCRQDIEKSVVEDAIENAQLYSARAERLPENDPERKKYFELALAEVDKVVVTKNERDPRPLFLKGLILRHYAPADAIQVLQRALDLDYEGSAHSSKLKALRDAFASLELGSFTVSLLGPQLRVEAMLYIAEAHEAVGNWEEASTIYAPLIKLPSDYATSAELQDRKILTGVSRCLYQRGFYDLAIKVGKTTLNIDRRTPGVHKLVAMPQLALGQVEAARVTMRRGILYEAPWDDKNRETNIACLEECLRDETTTMGGV
jgi:tetratricopeptide (TPR) repeat protein